MSSFSDWIRKFFIDEEYNKKMELIEREETFLSGLSEKGYEYDRGNEWWKRTWTTNEGKESILEVYQKLENGEWNKLMIGYGDRVFYEEKVDGTE